jgi:hypothetical protein
MTLLIPTSPTAELVALGWIKDVVTAYDIATGTTLQGPEPERRLADEAGYAHYGFELQVSWLPL